MKLDGPFGLSGTLAYFDLTRTNVTTNAPGSLTQTQTGEQNSHGFEADLVWQPTPSLSFLGSFAHIDAKVTRRRESAIHERAHSSEFRANSGRFWGHYAFDGALQGWSSAPASMPPPRKSSSSAATGRRRATSHSTPISPTSTEFHLLDRAARISAIDNIYVQYPYFSGASRRARAELCSPPSP